MKKCTVALFLILSTLLLMPISAHADNSRITQIEVAQEYIAKDNDAATKIAIKLDFISSMREVDKEDPSNMCGPLAASILYRSGYLDLAYKGRNFNISDFWLATPDALSVLLPPPYFSRIVLDTPVWSIDFKSNPLKLGDLVYLEGGMFDHILAVTKIETYDGGVRAYSVTNVFTKNGFVIDEYLLYDTGDDSVGLFKKDFRSTKSWAGQTGSTDVLIYRLS